jgi:hypothetical protein
MILKEQQRCCEGPQGCPKGQDPENCAGCASVSDFSGASSGNSRVCGGCGGGGCAGGGCGGCGSSGGRVIELNEEERAFLLEMSQLPFLPLARFVYIASDSEENKTVALAPVYLTGEHDSLDDVMKMREILQSLAAKRLVTLDYELPLVNGDYGVYKESDLYREFRGGPEEDGGSSYGRPALELGSIALTPLGREALDSIDDMR